MGDSDTNWHTWTFQVWNLCLFTEKKPTKRQKLYIYIWKIQVCASQIGSSAYQIFGVEQIPPLKRWKPSTTYQPPPYYVNYAARQWGHLKLFFIFDISIWYLIKGDSVENISMLGMFKNRIATVKLEEHFSKGAVQLKEQVQPTKDSVKEQFTTRTMEQSSKPLHDFPRLLIDSSWKFAYDKFNTL